MPRTPIAQLAVVALFSALICSHAHGDEWVTSVTTDDFGEETGERVFVNKFNAVWENSITRDAKSNVKVLIFEEKPLGAVRFELLNYGDRVGRIVFKEGWSISIKDDTGNVTEMPLKALERQLCFDDLDNLKMVNLLISNKTLNCFIELTGTSGVAKYSFKIEQLNITELLEPMMAEERKRIEAERKALEERSAMAAKKAEEQRLAMQLKEEAEAAKEKARQQLISTPMIFKTKDGKFSVNGLYLASNSTHVRLKRVDNNTEVTVELKLLSEDTVEQIKARK